ncbi:MAG: response regulator, partial [Chloroflexota bacterium]|nr:response regulator [Chloroflexota bacterium]
MNDDAILRNKLILITDDEQRIVRFVRVHFELEQARVIEAYDGQQCLEMVREHLPDLVVLDVMMPDMDGFETLQELRTFSTVPVIMLTVQAEEEDRIHGLDLGADDYMAKPFSPAELVSRTRAVLRRVQTPSDTRIV